jgi:HemY protein
MTSKPIRWVLWLFAMAAVAVLLALAGRYGSGYAVFVVPPWRIEVSMVMFCLLTLVTIGIFYMTIRLSIRAYQLPRQLRANKFARDKERVVADLHSSLKALFSGRFDDAEKLARHAMSVDTVANKDSHDIRNIAAALAAWAAHEGGNLPAALPYLEKITDDNAANMRDASKAYMLLAEGRAPEALPLLQSLAANDASNIGVLKMKLEAEINAAAWHDVILTLGPLKRTGLMPQSAVDDIRLNAEIEIIKSRPAQRDLLMDQWKKLETPIRYQPRLAEALACRLITLGLDNDAAAVIEETIAKYHSNQEKPDWTSDYKALAQRYATAKADATVSQIEHAESWLKRHPRDAVILATLGKLCMRQALWGKAQSYLEASVALQPTLDAHMTLARLMEQVGKPNDAMRHIRRSAELAKEATI